MPWSVQSRHMFPHLLDFFGATHLIPMDRGYHISRFLKKSGPGFHFRQNPWISSKLDPPQIMPFAQIWPDLGFLCWQDTKQGTYLVHCHPLSSGNYVGTLYRWNCSVLAPHRVCSPWGSNKEEKDPAPIATHAWHLFPVQKRQRQRQRQRQQQQIKSHGVKDDSWNTIIWWLKCGIQNARLQWCFGFSKWVKKKYSNVQKSRRCVVHPTQMSLAERQTTTYQYALDTCKDFWLSLWIRMVLYILHFNNNMIKNFICSEQYFRLKCLTFLWFHFLSFQTELVFLAQKQ